MNTEQMTAITALAVAVFALLVAIGQILGQYFNTADGYRRCQKAAVGGWAKNTRRRFRWSQMRFEVLYTTPHIGMFAHSGGPDPDFRSLIIYLSPNHRRIDGSPESRSFTFTAPIDRNPPQGRRTSSYLVSWIHLLEGLQDIENLYRDSSHDFAPIFSDDPDLHDFNSVLSIPYAEPREQTWDIMPPDLLRPAASASLGDIIMLAHRLGMGWREIRVGTGVLHAEGHGQSMVGSMSRGFGILLQYTRDQAFWHKNRSTEWRRLTIPSCNADKLGFGIIPGSLGIPDLSLQAEDGSLSEIHNTMNVLLMKDSEQSKVSKLWRNEKSFAGFSDVVALVPPFLPIKNCSITTVHRPLPDINGPLICREGREAFRVRLAHDISCLRGSGNHDVLDQLEHILERCTFGSKEWSAEWGSDGEGKAMRNNRDIELLEFLRQQHRYCTDLLCDIFLTAYFHSFSFTYRHLVGAHLSQATSAHIKTGMFSDENPHESLNPQYPTPPTMNHHLYQAFNMYVDNLEQIIDRVKATCDPESRTSRQEPTPGLAHITEDSSIGRRSATPCQRSALPERGLRPYTENEKDEQIRLAWWLMIFRAQCWYLSVSLIGPLDGSSNGRGGIIVPSSLWDSQVLVHIV